MSSTGFSPPRRAASASLRSLSSAVAADDSGVVGGGRDPLDALSPREREVLGMIAEGRSNQAIGDRLCVNAKTVESHVRSIFIKLGLLPEPDDHRRVLAVLALLRAG